MTFTKQLLEVQQELAVAVSSERKKDVMIEQLDKVGELTVVLVTTKILPEFLIRLMKSIIVIIIYLQTLFTLQTLAKVVEGWKRHENEKLIVINTLKQEREVQEQAHQKQQEVKCKAPST